MVVEIPAGIISTSEIRKDINDRYVSAYELYSDDESYIFEMVQENVEASCFVNESTGEISVSNTMNSSPFFGYCKYLRPCARFFKASHIVL